MNEKRNEWNASERHPYCPTATRRHPFNLHFRQRVVTKTKEKMADSERDNGGC